MWIFLVAVVVLAVGTAVTAVVRARTCPPLTREEQVLRINHLRARPAWDPVIEDARNHVHGIADV